MKRKRLTISVIAALVCAIVIGFVSGCEELESRDCVVMLGDSIFDLSDEITAQLQEQSSQEYRTYYLNGAQMDGGVIQDIESQYDEAIDDGPVRTIIMDGGGNDYLMGTGSEEEIATEVRAAYTRILDKAEGDGVENIVVLGYYKTESSPEGVEESTLQQAAALEAAGASRGINLVFVNPIADSWFQERTPSDYTISDGIHPTDAASARLAQLIWNAMVSRNIEQGADCSAFGPDDSGGCN